MVLQGYEISFRKELLKVLREIRDELHTSNELSRANYSKFNDEMAQLNETHEDLKQDNKDITHELRELNRSVEED